ncbi:MAG: penicillin-binding protein 2 [Bacteroidales bacterium]|jgi:penicillin-binding protein 2|nr:penicillin-binding protein 2 [Bacteroidales bacterium]
MNNRFAGRKKIVISIFLIVGIVFLGRIFYLQVLDKSYAEKANRNALRFRTQYPARGLMFDRNGELLVYNEVVYDLMVIPAQIKNLDTAKLCQLLQITKEDFNNRMDKAKKYSRYAPSIFEKQISKNDFALIQEKLYMFNGFYSQVRALRYYPKSLAAHVLGYVGEVNEKQIEDNPYYKRGDYIGMSGLEKSYEEKLRGIKGSRISVVDVHNREKGSYQNGIFDTAAVAGMNLYTTIDIELQEYAERLMANKRGSIVAIEPSTGEVLCFVSAPYYDPNLLVGRVRGNNYQKFAEDVSKPLFNRALMAQYPPGSIFKVAQALIALDMGVIKPNSGFPCDKSLVGCHNHPSSSNVRDAIKMSCNPYFYKVFQRIIQQRNEKGKIDSKYGLCKWDEAMLRMGFGTRLPIDLPNVKTGRIPDTTFYNKWYPAGWNFYTIFSNSIGQGEVEVVPLQMANFAAIVANRGWYITPHLVRSYGTEEKRWRLTSYSEKHFSEIPANYWDIAVSGMWAVVHESGGTARLAKVDGLNVCGKTGTAQNKGSDHSVFICFAPKDNPKIAISVYVENAAGGGGAWAAPIAGLLVEKYINREVKRKDFETKYIEINPCQPIKIKKNTLAQSKN